MDNKLAELDGQYRKHAAKFEELKRQLGELTAELAENRWHHNVGYYGLLNFKLSIKLMQRL